MWGNMVNLPFLSVSTHTVGKTPPKFNAVILSVEKKNVKGQNFLPMATGGSLKWPLWQPDNNTELIQKKREKISSNVDRNTLSMIFYWENLNTRILLQKGVLPNLQTSPFYVHGRKGSSLEFSHSIYQDSKTLVLLVHLVLLLWSGKKSGVPWPLAYIS